MVDVVRVKLRGQAEGSGYYNLKRNFCCRLAADGEDCHMTDNRKLLDPQAIPGEPLKGADPVAAAGAQR